MADVWVPAFPYPFIIYLNVVISYIPTCFFGKGAKSVAFTVPQHSNAVVSAHSQVCFSKLKHGVLGQIFVVWTKKP